MRHILAISLLLAACGANESSDNSSSASPSPSQTAATTKVSAEEFKKFCSQDIQKDSAIGPNFAGRFCTCLQGKYSECGTANVSACYDTAKKSFGEECFSIAVETAPEE